MTKKIYIIIAVVVVLAAAVFVWWNTMEKKEASQMQGTGGQQVDTTDAIQKDISNINIGNVDAEFKGVDETIKAL